MNQNYIIDSKLPVWWCNHNTCIPYIIDEIGIIEKTISIFNLKFSRTWDFKIWHCLLNKCRILLNV